MQIDSPKELNAYKKAYALAMEVFKLSKSFPVEERFALTSQIRRSTLQEIAVTSRRKNTPS